MKGVYLMKSIIFDVDGTLWDSTDVVAKSWNMAIREHTDLEANHTGASSSLNQFENNSF